MTIPIHTLWIVPIWNFCTLKIRSQELSYFMHRKSKEGKWRRNPTEFDLRNLMHVKCSRRFPIQRKFKQCILDKIVLWIQFEISISVLCLELNLKQYVGESTNKKEYIATEKINVQSFTLSLLRIMELNFPVYDDLIGKIQDSYLIQLRKTLFCERF